MVKPTASPDPGVAGVILRLLLDDLSVDAQRIEWRALGGLARRERVEQRLAAALERREITLPERFGDAVRRSRERTDRIVTLAARLGEACGRQGIAHVFLNLIQDHPDAGRGLELLLTRAPEGTDRLLLDRIPAVPGDQRLRGRLAGSTVYPIPALGTVLDVRHGRLGRLGEHGRFADLVLRRRVPARIGSATCSVPSPEDQLLLQALSQSCGRRSLPLRDAYWTLGALRAAPVDWRTLVPTAETLGLMHGLSCHLDFVDQIHTLVFRRPLFDASTRARLGGGRWGRVALRDGSFRFSVPRVTGRLYVAQLRAGLAAGDWASTARLCLLPVVAAPTLWRRVAGVRGKA